MAKDANELFRSAPDQAHSLQAHYLEAEPYASLQVGVFGSNSLGQRALIHHCCTSHFPFPVDPTDFHSSVSRCIGGVLRNVEFSHIPSWIVHDLPALRDRLGHVQAILFICDATDYTSIQELDWIQKRVQKNVARLLQLPRAVVVTSPEPFTNNQMRSRIADAQQIAVRLDATFGLFDSKNCKEGVMDSTVEMLLGRAIDLQSSASSDTTHSNRPQQPSRFAHLLRQWLRQ